VGIRLTQIAPVCRAAGRLTVNARAGRNRVRFAGRVGARRLPDGTYVAETPSGDVRFAIVRGRPTRDPARLASSVCQSGVLSAVASPVGAPVAAPRANAPSAGDGADSGPNDIPGPLPRVLGTSASRAAEAALSLHPVFYVLLAFAIASLAAGSLPARVLPQPAMGALLARRRAELTLAGTLSLLTVIVAYWLALLSG
jgi:hypothetical protein